MKHLFSSKLIIITFLLLIMGTTSAFACSCFARASVCNAFGGAKAVFVGKVIEGNSVERMSDMFKAGTKDLTFTFKVSRGFIGAKADETIEVHTGFGFGDCGFPFEKGEEYIVYAYENDKTKVISTGTCTRTTHISRAEEEISGLQTIFKSKGSSITGNVTRYERSSLLGEPRVPMAGSTVKLVRTGDRRQFFAKTNSEGEYSFAGLGAGKYRLVPPVGKGWLVEDYQTDEFLLNEHGCATNDLFIKNDSQINVQVLDPSGRPVPSIWVELVPISIKSSTNRSPDEFTVTNPQGGATFFDRPPGKYTISVNFFNTPDKEAPFPAVFAPGVEERSRAQVFEIVPGTHLSKTIIIKIPRVLEPINLSGVVIGPDGKPVKDAQVNLLDEKAPDSCVNGCGETNENGEFTVTGYQGRRYTIEALLRYENGNPSHRGVSKILLLDSNPKPLRILLKESKEP